MPEIITISLDLLLRLGSVNCYLVRIGEGFILVDTGSSKQRARLERELESTNCQPRNLKLILLTYGDFDHTGNAAYLREKYGAQVAMHAGDIGMAERGDMFSGRRKGNPMQNWLVASFSGFGKAQRFSPDIQFEQDCSLSDYGFEAQVLSIPGHSSGSIGILTVEGDLFCGDLMENRVQPALGSILDDTQQAVASLELLKEMGIQTVYPGHGQPFKMQALL